LKSAKIGPQAVFTEGSTMRHVIVMTAAASIGLMSVFVVDLLSLLYVSRLGDPNLTAAVGFATQVLFFAVSINIGLSIAIGALVSRKIGAGNLNGARRLAASGRTVADDLIERYHGRWRGNIDHIFAEFAF